MPTFQRDIVGPHKVWFTQCDLASCEAEYDETQPDGWVNVEYAWYPNPQRFYLKFCCPTHAGWHLASLGK